jgi:hypothetical protein
LQSKIREKSVLPTGFKAFKITIGDFEEDINLRGTTSFSLIKTPFAYKQIKAKQQLLHKHTLFSRNCQEVC